MNTSPPLAIPQPATDADKLVRVRFVREGSHHWEEGTLVSSSSHHMPDPPEPTTPKLERAKERQSQADQALLKARNDLQATDDFSKAEEQALQKVNDARDNLDLAIARVRELTEHVPPSEPNEPEGPTEYVHNFDVDPDDPDNPDRVTIHVYPPKRVEEAIQVAAE